MMMANRGIDRDMDGVLVTSLIENSRSERKTPRTIIPLEERGAGQRQVHFIDG